jgi:hypothetical protein
LIYKYHFCILAFALLLFGHQLSSRAETPSEHLPGGYFVAPLSNGDAADFARPDTVPEPQVAHPDSIPYSADLTLGRQLLKAPAAILHTAVLPLKWGIIFVQEKQVLSKLSNIFLNKEGTAGFYPNFSFGGRTDFAAGVTYFNRDAFNLGHSLDLNTFYTNPGNYKFGSTYKVPPNNNRRYQVVAQGDLRKNDDQDIFLGGNSGSEDEEFDYKISRYNFQADLGYLIRPNLLASFDNGIKHTEIDGVSEFTETGEPINQFVDLNKFGLGAVTLVNTGVNATLDLRNAGAKNENTNLVSTVTSSYDFKQTKTRIYSGALFDAGFNYNRSFDDAGYEFLYYYGDWQQFIPIPGLPPDRRLAFRSRIEKNYPLGSNAVPFYEQSFLGDSKNLRGYEQDRFRNLGSLLMTLEYRYPIWDTWDAVFFTDQGQVFKDFSQLSFSRFHGSVGTGLRFMTASDFLFRIEIAFSPEGAQTLLEFSTNF